MCNTDCNTDLRKWSKRCPTHNFHEKKFFSVHFVVLFPLLLFLNIINWQIPDVVKGFFFIFYILIIFLSKRVKFIFPLCQLQLLNNKLNKFAGMKKSTNNFEHTAELAISIIWKLNPDQTKFYYFLAGHLGIVA